MTYALVINAFEKRVSKFAPWTKGLATSLVLIRITTENMTINYHIQTPGPTWRASCRCQIIQKTAYYQEGLNKISQRKSTCLLRTKSGWKLTMYFIGLLLINLVIAEIHCSDGNRGGCSHTCYKNVCKCPPCWELDAGGLDCVPAENKVSPVYLHLVQAQGQNHVDLLYFLFILISK